VLAVMRETGTKPEFECFDLGILRSVAMFRRPAWSNGRRSTW
jgi:3-keto-5-aminohexanoate cleavage enzyme